MYRKTMLFATLLLPVVAAVPLQGAQEVAGSTIVLSTFDVRAASVFFAAFSSQAASALASRLFLV